MQAKRRKEKSSEGEWVRDAALGPSKLFLLVYFLFVILFFFSILQILPRTTVSPRVLQPVNLFHLFVRKHEPSLLPHGLEQGR